MSDAIRNRVGEALSFLEDWTRRGHGRTLHEGMPEVLLAQHLERVCDDMLGVLAEVEKLRQREDSLQAELGRVVRVHDLNVKWCARQNAVIFAAIHEFLRDSPAQAASLIDRVRSALAASEESSDAAE